MPFSPPTLIALLLAFVAVVVAFVPGIESDVSITLGLAAVVSAVLSLRERS